MKKNLKGLAAAIIVLATVAFTTTKKETKKVDTQASKITWTGEKLTGSHTGTIQLQEGYLNFEQNELTGGSFIIDMTTINVTDLKGEGKQKLEGHLKSDDFFGVKDHTKAMFNITNVIKKGSTYAVSGKMTIKGKTELTSFDMNVMENSATAKLTIDRTKFGIKYGSGSFFDNLGDNMIYDDFILDINLKF